MCTSNVEEVVVISEQDPELCVLDLFSCLLQCKGNEDGETVVVEKDHFMDDFFQQVKLQFSPHSKDLKLSSCAF